MIWRDLTDAHPPPVAHIPWIFRHVVGPTGSGVDHCCLMTGTADGSESSTNIRNRAWAKYALDEEIGAGAVLLAETSLDDVSHFREVWARISLDGSRPTPPGVEHETVEVAADGGLVVVHVFRPRGTQQARAAILLIHGGAFVGGSVQAVAAQACDLVTSLGVVTVAVEYRLAPEHPYPAGLDDCYHTLRWMRENADVLGIDPERIAVHGTSAGGGLAVALALRCRDSGMPWLRFLFLNSPEIDDRLRTESMVRYTDTPGFTRRDAEISWALYLGASGAAAADVSPYAAPARAEHYRDLPPTYLALMEFDPLRDEGLELGRRLLIDGVPLEMHLFPGTFHGSSALQHAEVSQREAAEEAAVFRRRLLDGGS